ncbi:hypothetical protein [Bradyrhizobium sp. CB2312]|uniref:hypothetical protein n=1 Tax=Bradyrhizobium sp. CB2312 TaxID=3039155 RepID=UPI0024B1B8DF|nr:hypothetical protein [Bradyrhizobium sp. CB2312]WFU77239.1 hypothetical protein QA642_28235 [Bradyrhizobium sp. CB2312]
MNLEQPSCRTAFHRVHRVARGNSLKLQQLSAEMEAQNTLYGATSLKGLLQS